MDMKKVAVIVTGSLAVAACFAFVAKHSAHLTEKSVVPPAALAHLPFKAEAVGHFDSGMPGLVGWKVKAQVGDNILYATPDGRFTFIGVVLDENGKNLSDRQAVEQLGASALSQQTGPAAGGQDQQNSQALAPQLSQLREQALDGLTLVGNKDGEIWIALDPMCPYCHQLVDRITRYLPTITDRVTVHYVPVCVLGPSSCEAVARLRALPKDRRLAAFTQWMRGESGNDVAKGFPVPAEQMTAIAAAASDAARIGLSLQEQGFSGVPDTFWMDKGVQHIRGVPSEAVIRQLLTQGK